MYTRTGHFRHQKFTPLPDDDCFIIITIDLTQVNHWIQILILLQMYEISNFFAQVNDLVQLKWEKESGAEGNSHRRRCRADDKHRPATRRQPSQHFLIEFTCRVTLTTLLSLYIVAVQSRKRLFGTRPPPSRVTHWAVKWAARRRWRTNLAGRAVKEALSTLKNSVCRLVARIFCCPVSFKSLSSLLSTAHISHFCLELFGWNKLK